MMIVTMVVILMIAIVPVAMVLRSKRRRLGTRRSGEPAHTDAASTLRLGEPGGHVAILVYTATLGPICRGRKWKSRASQTPVAPRNQGRLVGWRRANSGRLTISPQFGRNCGVGRSGGGHYAVPYYHN